MAKACRECGVPQELSEFTVNHHMADGRASVCKSCNAKHAREENQIKAANRREDMQEVFRLNELRALQVPAELLSKVYTLPDNMTPAKMAKQLSCPVDFVKAALLQGMGG